MKFSLAATVLGLAAIAAAAPTATTPQAPNKVALAKRTIYTVAVGLNSTGGLDTQYNPQFIQGINQGDEITFIFHTGNHTVTESGFAQPCHKNASNLIDTDFNNPITSEANLDHQTTFTFPDSTTRILYCKQKNFTPEGHCHKGMVFGINTTPEEYAQVVAAAAFDGLVM